MRRRSSYINEYGELVGGGLYEALQKQACYASLASRLPARAAEFQAESERWRLVASGWKERVAEKRARHRWPAGGGARAQPG